MTAMVPAVGREPRAHGERLVAEYRLPPDAIARYAALAAGAAADASARDNSMFADRSPWVGPMQRAGAGRNPYTLVFTVHGAARAAGQVFAQWQAGWEVHESADASREVLMAVPGTAREATAAGEALSLSASSKPVSFRGDRSVSPMLGLVQTRNFDISEVQVQVWSGNAPLPWPMVSRPSTGLLALATACLLAWLALRYWRYAHVAAPRTDFAPSTLSGRSSRMDSRMPLDSRMPPDSRMPLESTADVASEPLPTPPARPADHRAQVVDDLRHVLQDSPAVASVPDPTHARRR